MYYKPKNNKMSDTKNLDEVKEKVIGEFKPKRKFLNFFSAVVGNNGTKVRFIRDTAFLDGKYLSGMLENIVFKITICDEGTINFDEVDTTQTDKAQRQRLLNDIDDLDVTGYAKKFILSGIKFKDKDGLDCFLEVEHQKPIDRLRSIFDESKSSKKVSDKGLSILDQLFGDSEEDLKNFSDDKSVLSDKSDNEVKIETETTEVKRLSFIEQQFIKMNKEKVMELEYRIEEKTKEIQKINFEITQNEKKLSTSKEQLEILQTRLDSMNVEIVPNGFVFFVSDEKKSKIGLDETTKHIADKIADLMKLKKDVLFEYLTESFYDIKIAQKNNLTNSIISEDPTKLYSEINQKISNLDINGNISQKEFNEFEYRGKLNWHQIVDKMIRMGFEQSPEFDKMCLSNSYESKTEDKKCGCVDECGGCDGSCENCKCETNKNENNTKS